MSRFNPRATQVLTDGGKLVSGALTCDHEIASLPQPRHGLPGHLLTANRRE
jgi:hypothetical protein